MQVPSFRHSRSSRKHLSTCNYFIPATRKNATDPCSIPDQCQMVLRTCNWSYLLHQLASVPVLAARKLKQVDVCLSCNQSKLFEQLNAIHGRCRGMLVWLLPFPLTASWKTACNYAMGPLAGNAPAVLSAQDCSAYAFGGECSMKSAPLSWNSSPIRSAPRCLSGRKMSALSAPTHRMMTRVANTCVPN